MPRLEGVRNNSSVHTIMAIVLVLAVLWLMEYYGLINVINGFGAPGLAR